MMFLVGLGIGLLVGFGLGWFKGVPDIQLIWDEWWPKIKRKLD